MRGQVITVEVVANTDEALKPPGAMEHEHKVPKALLPEFTEVRIREREADDSREIVNLELLEYECEDVRG